MGRWAAGHVHLSALTVKLGLADAPGIIQPAPIREPVAPYWV
jgi:hypothetical protein